MPKFCKLAFKASFVLAVSSSMFSPVLALPFVTGDIFAAVNSGNVRHYNSAGTLLETLNTLQSGFTTGMAFDGSDRLNVTNFSSGNITRFDSNGAIIAPNPFASPGANPESIAFSTSGEFYVGRASGQVQRYSGAGVLQQTYSMPQNTDWIDLAANQTALFFNDEGGAIKRWDLTTDTALADFANNTTNGGTNSFALRILSNGDVLSAAGSQVNQYDSTGLFLGSYDVSSVDGFFALNLAPDGTHFWSGSFGNDTLYRFLIGSFGGNASDQSIVTGLGGGNLFGVAIAGEITVGGPPPGVPEPASWAMMLAGFGLAGSAMRRARVAKISFA